MRKIILSPAARGWCHDDWYGAFYPDDLPPEWRLAYYANEFRSLLATEQECVQGYCDDWAEELSGEFALCVEATTLAGAAALHDWLSGKQGKGIKGLLLRSRSRDEGMALFEKYSDLSIPLFLDVNVDELTHLADHGKVNCLWRPGRNLLPGTTAGLCAGIISDGDYDDDRSLRQLAEEFLQACPPGCSLACLFVEGAPPELGILQRLAIMADLL